MPLNHNTSIMETVRVRFPCLSVRGSTVLHMSDRDFLRFDYVAAKGDRVLLKGGCRPVSRLKAVITPDGMLIEFSVERVRRRIFAPISSMIDFTLAECTVQVTREPSVDWILARLEELSDKPEFRTRSRLKQFLEPHRGRQLDEALMSQYWGRYGGRASAAYDRKFIDIPATAGVNT